MKILITNDDGIYAEGLLSLIKAFIKENDVIVAAPDSERSGSGHSTSLKTPFKYKKVDLVQGAMCYSVSGTPADCVKFGISYIAKNDIDIVISGINHGRNLGTDVLYSGTVGAALEAVIGGYSALALSYGGKGGWHFDYAASFAVKNISKLREFSAAKYALNINFPDCMPDKIKGVKITPLGREKYNDRYIAYKANGKDEGYILDGLPHILADNPPDCDIVLSSHNYITVTPLNLDLTDYGAINNFNGDIAL